MPVGYSYVGRKTPYTQIGIRRLPCARCGATSTSQWQVCANGNRYLGICRACDVALNEVVLTFFRRAFRKQRRSHLLRAYHGD